MRNDLLCSCGKPLKHIGAHKGPRLQSRKPLGELGQRAVNYATIRKLRQEMDLSQEDFAEKVGVSDRVVVCRWERRLNRPSPMVVRRIRELMAWWDVEKVKRHREKMDGIRLVKRKRGDNDGR